MNPSRHRIVVLAIVALATALRILWPGIAEFKVDEVQPLALADEVWRSHHLPLTRGTTSWGLPGTPLLGYLLVLPRAVSMDPRAAVVFLGLLGSLAVVATYLGLRRVADERLALVAAALYAVNPWAIFYTRKTWSEVLPLFTVLILWAACQVVLWRKPAWGLAFFPLLAIQFQTHLLAIAYLPAVALTVLLFWPRWRNRYTLWGAALGMLILLPYGLALARSWGTSRAVLQGAGSRLTPDPRAIAYGLWFASGATATALLGQSAAILRPWECALEAVNLLTAGLLAWALGLSVWAVLRREPAWERLTLLLVWLLGPLLAMVLMPGVMGIHYLQLLLPALFVLAAIGWTRLMNLPWRALAWAGGAALVSVLAIQTGVVLAVYDSVPRYPTAGGFGRPLQLWQQVQRGIQARAAAEGKQEVQVLGLEQESWPNVPAALDYLLGSTVRPRYVSQGGRRGLLLPEQGSDLALVLAADGEFRQALDRFGELVDCWPVPGDTWGIRLYRLRAWDTAVLAPEMIPAASGTFDNGMRLLGVRLPATARPGDTLALLTCWTYTGGVAPASAADTAFNHLLDSQGKRWAQDDGFALPRSEWRTGETLLQWFTLSLPGDLPPGEYWLYTGMYSWRDMSRAQVLDKDGRWLSDGFKFGPVRILAVEG